MPRVDIDYDQLPNLVKNNLDPEQWEEAQEEVVLEGIPVPETTFYINLKNGQIKEYSQGDVAPGPLLPTHQLAGARGKEDAQFETEPEGAHPLALAPDSDQPRTPRQSRSKHESEPE